MWGSTVDNSNAPGPPSISVYSERGSGGVLAEAVLTLLGRPYTLRDVALFPEHGEATPEQLANAGRLARVNPMRQAPTVVIGGDLNDRGGLVMTESAAILIGLADLHPASGLAPAPNDPARAAFLRWMLYIPAQIYPMYWVRDVPARLAGDDPAQQTALAERAMARVAECWAAMDKQVRPAPWLAGERMTVLDLYVTVVSRFTPRRRRFYEIAPRMAEVVRRVDAEPRLQALWADRFPFEPGWEG
jgi:GST-like protein